MLSVVCNRDLPEDLFDVKDEIVVHVADNVEDAIQYSKVDAMVLIANDWRTRHYLKSIKFESMVVTNPNICFLVISKSRGFLEFLNFVMDDCNNINTALAKNLKHIKITDKPAKREKTLKERLYDLNDSWDGLLFGKSETGIA